MHEKKTIRLVFLTESTRQVFVDTRSGLIYNSYMEKTNWGVYIFVIIFSVLFLFVGNRVASRGFEGHVPDEYWRNYTGVVTEIIERVEEIDARWGEGDIIDITFNVRLTSGERRGEIITTSQSIDDFFLVNEREVSVGDRVILSYDAYTSNFFFSGYIRITYIAILGVIFLALVIFFGRQKGFNAIVALGFTCLAIFLVFIPAILSGGNIYVATIIICVYSVVSTLLIVIGSNKKAVSAMLGCLGGVFLAGGLMLAMDAILRLTSGGDSDTEMLLLLPTQNPIDLRAIIFAGVLLGAIGAIMDVSMSISSSLWEVKEAGGSSSFPAIFKSGINIGKDIFGTMLNTLILAYIGSSLSLLLLIAANNPSLMMILNMEMIIVEFLRALIGSFGMFLAIPLTAAVCAWLYHDPFGDY